MQGALRVRSGVGRRRSIGGMWSDPARLVVVRRAGSMEHAALDVRTSRENDAEGEKEAVRQKSRLAWRGAVHDALRDSFGRAHTYLRVSLTERCNLRCTYCMPAAGVQLTPNEQLLTPAELERLTLLFASLGVRKLRLTGGEPTVRRDFDNIVQRMSAVPGLRVFGVTSNGIALRRKLPMLAAAGVTRLNISLDTLDATRFANLARRPGLELVLASLNAALSMPQVFAPVKLNVVVMRGVNDDELLDFVRLAKEHEHMHVRFIEYMPFGGNNWSEPKFLPYQEMKRMIERGFGQPLVAAEDANSQNGSGVSQTGDHSEQWAHKTAKVYQMAGIRGRIGFVSSMSEHFCGGCTRLRLTADGNFKVCLFGSGEISLRDSMRRGDSDEQLIDQIGAAVQRKAYALGGSRDRFDIASKPNRPMITIGG